MAFTPYATIPELKAWVTLNDTLDDVVMAAVLDDATRGIDEYCDRHFWRDGATGAEVARSFVSNCGFDVTIDDLVPGTITTLKTDATGDGVFETTWSAADYQLLPVNRPNGEPFTSIEAVGTLMFPTRTNRMTRANRVEVTGVWGWTAVPSPIKQACLLLANRELKRRYSPEGVAGFGEFGAVRITSEDRDVVRKLNPKRRNETAVLVA